MFIFVESSSQHRKIPMKHPLQTLEDIESIGEGALSYLEKTKLSNSSELDCSRTENAVPLQLLSSIYLLCGRLSKDS